MVIKSLIAGSLIDSDQAPLTGTGGCEHRRAAEQEDPRRRKAAEPGSHPVRDSRRAEQLLEEEPAETELRESAAAGTIATGHCPTLSRPLLPP